MPLVIAASGSARSGDIPPAVISGRPSAETISACVTPGVEAAKLSTTQAKSCGSRGAVAGYYPELNPLLPLDYYDMISGTPAAKSIPVRVIAL